MFNTVIFSLLYLACLYNSTLRYHLRLLITGNYELPLLVSYHLQQKGCHLAPKFLHSLAGEANDGGAVLIIKQTRTATGSK